MTNKFRLLIYSLVLLSAMSACKDPSPSDPDVDIVNGFDKKAMLVYYADSVIIPRYQLMQQKLSAMQTAGEQFLAAPSPATQAGLKIAYRDAHLQYVQIAAFQFGPAETLLLDIFANYSGGLDYDFNTSGELTGFSIDTTTIETNIASGAYDLTKLTRNNFYAQGFPALNYLFFAPDAIERFATNPDGRIKYTRDVTTRLISLVNQVAGGWATYREDFITNTKTNVGSPIGNMVNQLAYQMDLLKGPRIGWPFGKQSGGMLFPTKCEAYYAGISAELAAGHLSALKAVYNAGGSGKGLSNYLVALNKSALNDEVLAQFDAAYTALLLIPDPMSEAFTAEPAKVEAAYKEIQKLLTLLKTDIASATGVQITFTDNDGD